MGLKSRSVLYYQAEMASVCGKRLCIQTFAIHILHLNVFPVVGIKERDFKKPLILSAIKMSLFIWKSSQFYFWTETSLAWFRYITSTVCIYSVAYKGDVLLQCLSPWELGSCIVREEIKIRAFWKVVRTSFHCTWSDINTVNAGTCWQFYPNFLVRISFTRILRLTIRDIF